MTLDTLNTLGHEEAVAALLRCCGSITWAERMAGSRPFSGFKALLARADELWGELSRPDCLEAFAAHPKIGDVHQLKEKFASTADWSSGEQSGVNHADEQVLERLALGNQRYEQTFGYRFIVCATGKSAAEMVALLEARLGHAPGDEWAVACDEQAKIMKLRLEKLVSPPSSSDTK